MVLVNRIAETRMASTNHYHESNKFFHGCDRDTCVLQFLPDPLHHLDSSRIIPVNTERICLQLDFCLVHGNHLSLQSHLQRPFCDDLMIVDHRPFLSPGD